LRALRRALDLSLPTYLWRWGGPAVAGLAVFGVLSGVLVLLPPIEGLWAQLGAAAGGGLVALALYGGLGLLLFRSTVADLTSVVRRRRVT
jgi:hypothetical protein